MVLSCGRLTTRLGILPDLGRLCELPCPNILYSRVLTDLAEPSSY
jgi:hypothetical protein